MPLASLTYPEIVAQLERHGQARLDLVAVTGAPLAVVTIMPADPPGLATITLVYGAATASDSGIATPVRRAVGPSCSTS
jgi:hypothetical protein